MSQTSAGGSGGSTAPGWYTDPHDPNGLRWWSGEGWTEHTSPGAAPAQPTAQPVQAAPPQAPPLDPQAVLPSRRALRDPATEASEAAESALRAQAAQQQADTAQQAQQTYAAQQAPQAAAFAAPEAPLQQVAPQQVTPPPPAAQQPSAAVPSTPVPSTPVPTLPVAPTSFLEQQGYAPLDSAPADPNAWNQPVAVQPVAAQQPPAQPPQAAALQPPQAAPVQPNAWNQPVQPSQPAAPAQPTQANAWNQPVQPEQPGWGAPAATSDGIDSLFGGAAAPAAAGTQGSQSGQWALSPTGPVPTSRRSAASETEVAGSSTFWGWLIAISPILAAGSVIYVLLATKTALTDWPFEAAVAAPYLLVLLFALADRTVLLQLGHAQPRSPGWALLSAPIYLIARAGETRREDGSGTALTLAWFVSVLVGVGAIVGYGFLTGHALIAGLPT